MIECRVHKNKSQLTFLVKADSADLIVNLVDSESFATPTV